MFGLSSYRQQSDGAVQHSWEISLSEFQEVFTAQHLTSSVGLVWSIRATAREGCRLIVLVDLLPYCNEPSRMRGRACTMACGFGLAWGTKPPCRLVARGAAVGTMAWGAGRCATGGTRRGSQGSAYGFSLGACWLAGARRRAGSRVLLGAHPSRDTDMCWRLLDKRYSGGALYGGSFKVYPPPANLTFFRLCEICLCVQRTLCT